MHLRCVAPDFLAVAVPSLDKRGLSECGFTRRSENLSRQALSTLRIYSQGNDGFGPFRKQVFSIQVHPASAFSHEPCNLIRIAAFLVAPIPRLLCPSLVPM